MVGGAIINIIQSGQALLFLFEYTSLVSYLSAGAG